MSYLLLLVLVIVVVFGPSLWVSRVMRRYSEPADRYPGTGGELARHLLDGLELGDVGVEATDAGDHYDPQARVVRLSPDKFAGRSLTAITVAAHEVGHAMQHRDGFGPLAWRTRLVHAARWAEKLGAGLLLGAPAAAILLRTPAPATVFVIGGLLSLGSVAVVHLVTLPTEMDASFTRAMPMLEGGNILLPGDRTHARRLLAAAALTYVAAALVSLLNIGRWFAILRR